MPWREKARRRQKKSKMYDIVDIIYNSEDGKYVPNCFVCKVCSLAMVSHGHGGNSVVRSHPCVKSYLKNLKNRDSFDEDDDEDENFQFYLNQVMLTNRQKVIIADAFGTLLQLAGSGNR